jgi:putative membrane protein
MAPEDSSRDPRVFLAAERTFLAWIRTSLALMAFGFVIARFGLFLRELEATHSGAATAPSALSLPLGIGFVLIGVVTNILACVHHLRYVRALNAGEPQVGKPSMLAIVLAIILAIAGLGMTMYLGATGEGKSSGEAKSQTRASERLRESGGVFRASQRA